MTTDEIAAVIARKRRVHPELTHALSWCDFLRICERERVQVRVRQGTMARPGLLVPYLGEWTIIISGTAPPRRHTYIGVHELGHLWLHHDRSAERWERVYNMDYDWSDDPREDDAELFASLVLMGPRQQRAVVRDPRAESHLRFALRTIRRVPRGPRP